METSAKANADSEHEPSLLERLIAVVPRILIPMFSLFFLTFALLYAGTAMVEFIRAIVGNGEVIGGIVKSLHMAVVALAVYELSQIVYRESDQSREPEDTMLRIHRGILRFASVVFVALVLEALILVIKYSHQEMAGFLYYPVAIIAGAAFLLIALGVYNKLTIMPARNANKLAGQSVSQGAGEPFTLKKSGI